MPDNSPFVLRAVMKKPLKSGVDPSLALSVTDEPNKKYTQYYFSKFEQTTLRGTTQVLIKDVHESNLGFFSL